VRGAGEGGGSSVEVEEHYKKKVEGERARTQGRVGPHASSEGEERREDREEKLTGKGVDLLRENGDEESGSQTTSGHTTRDKR
jgi:hypothetical protein